MEIEVVVIIAVVVVLLVGLALWLGRGVKIGISKDKLSIETKSTTKNQVTTSDIVVGENLNIEEAKVGDVAAVKSAHGAHSTPSDLKASVLKGGKIVDSEVGDIVGVKIEGKADNPKQ